MEKVVAFCSSDEEDENINCLQFLPIAPEIEDPEDNWLPTETSNTTANQNVGPPPAKKKKYKSYDIALENVAEGGKL